MALAAALPLHYPYGLATIGHLGIIYLDALLLVVGVGIAFWETRPAAVQRLRRAA